MCYSKLFVEIDVMVAAIIQHHMIKHHIQHKTFYSSYQYTFVSYIFIVDMSVAMTSASALYLLYSEYVTFVDFKP